MNGTTTRTQGTKANKSGSTAENVIASVLSSYGIRFERQKYIGLSIYEHDLRADFSVQPSVCAPLLGA